MVHARDRAGVGHRCLAVDAADRPVRSVSARRRPRCSRRCAGSVAAPTPRSPARSRATSATRCSRAGRSLRQPVLHRLERTTTSATTSARRRDDDRGHPRSLDDAGARPWLRVAALLRRPRAPPDRRAQGAARRRASTAARPAPPSIAHCSAAIDDELGQPARRSSSSGISSTTRSSSSRAITASRSATIRACSRPTARSPTRRSIRDPARDPHPGCPWRPAHRSGEPRRSRADAALAARRAGGDPAARRSRPRARAARCPRGAAPAEPCARRARRAAVVASSTGRISCWSARRRTWSSCTTSNTIRPSTTISRRTLPDVVTRLRARYAEQPEVKIDRTPEGRSWRERQAARH